jgi:uroporphyrinogen III methyltransferase / synthase
MSVGKVWLVGAGPGDPDLITVRGLEVLSQAEVVLHDALSHAALLEFCRNAEIHDVGKRYGERYSALQEAITEKLLEFARKGKRVVRLKGGDPFMFARGSEEAIALARAGIPFEIVPGISSPVAASAYAGISLTHRDLSSSVTFITGSDRAGKEWSPAAWKKLATATDTICVLMGMSRIEQIALAIVEGGRSPATPAAVIQWGARPEQRVVSSTLGNIAQAAKSAGLSNPAVILIGEVVKLRDEIRWFDTQPLFGKRVLVPRPEQQARASARAIRARGAEPIVFPAIEIVPPPDPGPLRQAAAELDSYDWVLFTSANGVDRLFEVIAELERDARAFGRARIGVIGPKTAAALRTYGIRPDLVADEFIGESLAQAVLERGVGGRVLLARALEARDALPDLLRKAGAEVNVVAAYRTRSVGPERGQALAELIQLGKLDVILFTSSSTVESLVSLLGPGARELLSRVTLASIGPITTRTLTEHGLLPKVIAQRYTLEGVLDALSAHYAA